MKKLAWVLVVGLLSLPAPASADIIELVFTGSAVGHKATADNPLAGFVGPYRADFIFNTQLGLLQTISPGSYRLDGGLVSAFIDFALILANLAYGAATTPISPVMVLAS